MTARRIAIVPHTHWDREWYKSYQNFRLSLVELIDTLIPLLETDASYPHFMLDGQMAVIDDYLEVRPEMEGRLRALAAAGRVSVGPWYILMDEFLSSGETIWRNLQMGIERGAAFGGVMDVGYLPDMFGHIAQMPQILAAGGFRDTVVWRGVPSSVTKNAFVWESPDGSSVRAEYLPVGYGNGAALPDDAKSLIRRTQDNVAEIESFLIDDLLCMNGSDHLMPQPFLGRVVAEANDIQDEFVFEVTSLPSYLARGSTQGLTGVQGELRSGYRANMLMGVTSNRVDVKRAGAAAERELERRAEPLSALYLPASEYPTSLLGLAWREMVRNSAHDSICACSVDDVVDAVLHRYAEARRDRLGSGRAGAQGLRPLAVGAGADRGQPLGPDPLRGGRAGGAGGGAGLCGRAGALGADGYARLHGARRRHRAHRSGDDAGTQDQRRRMDTRSQGRGYGRGYGHHDLGGARGEGRSAHRRGQAGRVHQAGGPARLRGAGGHGPTFDATHRGPFGRGGRVRVGRLHAGGAGASGDGADDGGGAVSLSNGLVSVEIDGATGTFSLNGVSGYGRLVDEGDLGDSYNYSPPRQDSMVDTPSSVSGAAGRAGPGAGPGPHHGRLPLARPRRRPLAGPGGRTHGDGDHRRRGAGRRARGAGHDLLREPERGSPPARAAARCPRRRTTPRPRAPTPWSAAA